MTTEIGPTADPIRVVVQMPRALVEQIDEAWRRRLYESRSDLIRKVLAAEVGCSDAAF